MKQIVVGFTDTIEPVADFFVEALAREYEVVRDDAKPNYLFFGDRNFGEKNKTYKDCVKIFYTGENQRFWDYECHYAITFDHIDSDHHYRLPLYVIYNWDNKRKGITYCGEFGGLFNQPPEQERTEFCAFVVKNGGCSKRNEFFYKLNKVGGVNSCGPLFNNTGYVLPSGDQAVQSKLDYLRKHRFNLCFENDSYPGYVTEKIYEAFIAGCVPIYWGSPTIEVDFNPNEFLNWHEFVDDEKLLSLVSLIENDSYHRSRFRNQNLFVRPNKYMDINRLVHWFSKNVYKG